MKENINTAVAARPLIQSNTTTTFTDNIHIATRTDGIIFIQFMADTPTALMENFRTMMTQGAAVQFLNALSQAVDYYPVKKIMNNELKAKKQSKTPATPAK